MKYKGHSALKTPKHVEVFEREEGAIVFVLQATRDYKIFEALCPMPSPSLITHANGRKEYDVTTDSYHKRLTEYAAKQTAWGFYQAIKGTEGLEFETVVEDDPDTWKNAQAELQEFLLPHEWMRLQNAWVNLNQIDEDRIKIARDSFLSGDLSLLPWCQSSPSEDPSSSSSGEPASDLESDQKESPTVGTIAT